MTIDELGTEAYWNWVFVSIVPLMTQGNYERKLGEPTSLYVDKRFKGF